MLFDRNQNSHKTLKQEGRGFCPSGHILEHRYNGHCNKCTLAYDLRQMREQGLTNKEILAELNEQDIEQLFTEYVNKKKFYGYDY